MKDRKGEEIKPSYIRFMDGIHNGDDTNASTNDLFIFAEVEIIQLFESQNRVEVRVIRFKQKGKLVDLAVNEHILVRPDRLY